MNKEELEKIKQKALQNHIPIIMDDTLEVIEKELKQNPPKRILEIGAAVGYSAMCFSEFLADGGKIDTIERDEERIREAKENFKKVGVWEKIKLYEEFYANFQAKDCGFDKKPQLIIIGEDDEHIVEIFKAFKRINAELKGIEVYYSTDLRQLEPEMDKTLITFRQDKETGRYKMDMLQQFPLLEK